MKTTKPPEFEVDVLYKSGATCRDLITGLSWLSGVASIEDDEGAPIDRVVIRPAGERHCSDIEVADCLREIAAKLEQLATDLIANGMKAPARYD